MDRMKQVIVVDESLKLPRGKLAAQVAHAAVDGFLSAGPQAQREWLLAGMPKVVLRVQSPEDLLELDQRAKAAGLPTVLIRDAGRTVIAEGTATCLAIGPAPPSDIDALTGDLSLVR